MSQEPRTGLIPTPPQREAWENWGDGYSGQKVSSRQEVWNPGTLQWERMTQPGGGGGGGGPVTIADAADVAEGATTDAAVVTDTTGTVSGKLRGLVKWAFERMPASLGQKTMAASLPVVVASDQSAVPVSGTFFQATQPVSAPVGTPVAARLSDGAAFVPTVNNADADIARVGLVTDARNRVWNGASWDRLPGGTDGVTVRDGGGSVTVDAPVGTPVWARLSDGAAVLIGQKAMAASLPVVVASDQSVIPVNNSQWLGSAAPTVGQKTMASSVPVTLASDQTNVPVSQATASNLNAQVVGELAHDAVDSGNPQKIGGKAIAAAATPAFVSAAGDRVNAAFDGAGRQMMMEPPCWTITSVPAANAQATANKAASAGVKHVLTGLLAEVHNSGAATAIMLTVVIRDGATGVGTILWTFKLAVLATTLTTTYKFLNDLHIVGTAGNAMTVEFTAAGGVNTNEIVNAVGYDTI